MFKKTILFYFISDNILEVKKTFGLAWGLICTVPSCAACWLGLFLVRGGVGGGVGGGQWGPTFFL